MRNYITFTVLFFLICSVFGFGQQDIQGAHQNDEDVLRNATIKFKTLLARSFQETDNLSFRPLARKVTRDYPRNIGNDIFQDVVIDQISPIMVEEFEPNLSEASIRVSASWETVEITGLYNQAGQTGDFRLTLENIRAEGIAGIALGNFGSFETPSVENLKVTLSYGHYELKNAATNRAIAVDNVAISNIINEYFNFDVSQVVRQDLRSHINGALQKVSIDDVFEQDLSRSKYYSTALEQRATNADGLADFLLNVLRTYFQQNGFTNVKVPDIYHTFKKKWGVGSFLADNGYVTDPTTIQKTGPFSIDGDFANDNFALYGSVGFQTLKAKFYHYRVKVGSFSIAGEIQAKVIRNSVYFLLSGRLINNSVIKVSGYEFEIRELSDIKVEATGLSFAFNWLLNIIATRVMNNMRDDIRIQLQNSVRDMINSRLEAMNYEIPLGI